MKDDKLRMSAWLAIGLALYFASQTVSQFQYPGVQTVLYKLGHVTTLAWFGYWIARQGIGRIYKGSTDGEKIARGIVMGSVIIAGSLGL